MGLTKGAGAPPTNYHIHAYGKYADALFQKYRVAAEFLAKERPDVQATVQGFFETQYQQQLKLIKSTYGGSFTQAKPSNAIVFAETDDAILYFSNETRFFEWARKRFEYEDNTRVCFYNRIGNKMVQQVKESIGRSYCALGFAVGDQPEEVVHLELFDEECPTLARNFLDLLAKPEFKGHPVHRVKAGSWIQAGDLVDGSGLHSTGADGNLLRDESFNFRHDRAGLIGMCNHGKDTNGSQFYITLREMPFLDGKSVIFGRVIGGMRGVLQIGKLATRNERPVQEVRIYAQSEFSSMGGIQQQIDAREEDAATKLQSVARGRKDRASVQAKKGKR